ncbi:MAG TPA: hypothetical protein VGH33_15355 [Isosphaeraceae bacterium]|jgi:hypothetical protein
MKTATLTILLALTAAPALALDFPIFLGHHDPEYRGFVDHWPQVRRIRAIDRMCPAQQLAIFEQDKRMLEMTTRALYGPAFGRATSSTATPAYSYDPTPAPPPPTVPTTPR